MIDINKLQLDDYLYCGDKILVRVRTLIKSGLTGNSRIDTYCVRMPELGNCFLENKEEAERYRLLTFDDLHYVPLTEEYLMKYFPDPDELSWWPVGGGVFHIEYEVCKEDASMGGYKNILYVHELQHTLKEIGINKEIEP